MPQTRSRRQQQGARPGGLESLQPTPQRGEHPAPPQRWGPGDPGVLSPGGSWPRSARLDVELGTGPLPGCRRAVAVGAGHASSPPFRGTEATSPGHPCTGSSTEGTLWLTKTLLFRKSSLFLNFLQYLLDFIQGEIQNKETQLPQPFSTGSYHNSIKNCFF